MLHFYKESLKAIVISGFLFSCITLYSQENVYFENQPVWHENVSCAIPYPCVETDDFNYYIDGDTIIDELTYLKLYKQGVKTRVYYDNNPPEYCTGSNIYLHNLKGYIRSSNKQIYYRTPSTFQEQLLYDFNLIIGDTLPHTFITNPWGISIVIDIDSINVMGNFYKRFHLEGLDSPAPFLIEGIGSVKGFLAPIPHTFECGFGLSCYSQNGTIIYGDGSNGSCMLTVGIEDENPATGLSLYPNPTSSYSTLQLRGVSGQVDILIHDFSGRQVRQYSADANREFSFYSGELPQGIYLLSINQDGRLLGTEKLVVAR